MNIIIGIETSSALCSVALQVADTLFENTRLVQRSHNQVLLPMLDALFQEAGIRPGAVDLVCFGAGPGSFTGVRMAAATAQALALAAAAPVLPVRSSEVLARAGFSAHPDEQRLVTSIHSRADAYYLALFERSGNGPQMRQTDALFTSTPDWLSETALMVGEPPAWLAAHPALRRSQAALSARFLLERARQADAGAVLVDAALALPLYLEADSPWRPAAAGVGPAPG